MGEPETFPWSLGSAQVFQPKHRTWRVEMLNKYAWSKGKKEREREKERKRKGSGGRQEEGRGWEGGRKERRKKEGKEKIEVPIVVWQKRMRLVTRRWLV